MQWRFYLAGDPLVTLPSWGGGRFFTVYALVDTYDMFMFYVMILIAGEDFISARESESPSSIRELVSVLLIG